MLLEMASLREKYHVHLLLQGTPHQNSMCKVLKMLMNVMVIMKQQLKDYKLGVGWRWTFEQKFKDQIIKNVITLQICDVFR